MNKTVYTIMMLSFCVMAVTASIILPVHDVIFCLIIPFAVGAILGKLA